MGRHPSDENHFQVRHGDANRRKEERPYEPKWHRRRYNAKEPNRLYRPRMTAGKRFDKMGTSEMSPTLVLSFTSNDQIHHEATRKARAFVVIVGPRPVYEFAWG
jgi:hypothetical protein